MKFGIVVTTIFDGSFLDEYVAHFRRHDGCGDVTFYVVADLKTPPSCREAAARAEASGLRCTYLAPDEQVKFLDPFPDLAAEIPWNTDNRRNVGFLMAYRDRCDVIVAIDDDNYPKPEWPFLEGHSSVGQMHQHSVATGYGGWFNLCSMMDIERKATGTGGTVYARGFPYARRDVRCSGVCDRPASGRVAINVGLWSGDPDVDAATRLVTRCEMREAFTDSLLLGHDTLMPINTQNTALLREAIPAYYYVKMGHPLAGMKLDRFGDIFSGFFVQKCAQAVGDRVRVGDPVVEHRRTPHNLYKDLWHELAGMVVIDDMLPLLETPLNPAPDYPAAALELADRLERWSRDCSGFLWDDGLKAYFRKVSANIRLWVEVCNALDH